MAMEGAAVLAEELAWADRGDKTLAHALTDYAGRRRSRVDTIARLSRAVIERGQLTNPVSCWLRDRRIQREGRSIEQTESTLAELLAWPAREGEE
jgi:2-polyprenyl-6-methoxyphenol hydroxylase-like FAD-dependent oxidoreductase